MPCSDQHFVPILDELRAREEAAAPIPKRGRGGPRPGSGPPKGNLNALKHGRFSTRHKRLLEALLVVPEARDALISIAKRNRQRRRKAEVEAAYLLLKWLATNNPDFPAAALNIPNDQTKNDQLTSTLANLEAAFKRRISRKTTRKRSRRPRVNQKRGGPNP